MINYWYLYYSNLVIKKASVHLTWFGVVGLFILLFVIEQRCQIKLFDLGDLPNHCNLTFNVYNV